jgi:amino acid adenylation domain-containing protein/non-ribosomal peptide synthase protein (TIGR01720 family)
MSTANTGSSSGAATGAQSPDHKALMKKAVLELRELRTRLDAEQRARSEPIAIIGLGCRFPGGADDPERFWELLRRGGDGISEVPTERWSNDVYYDPDPQAPGKICTRYGGFVDNLFGFDPQLFNIVPREAASMDPQQRMLLEVSWMALEHANLRADRLYRSQTGVFIGISTFDSAVMQLGATDLAQVDAYCGTGNALSAANGRLAYVLGLTGPSLSIDTACSSSLVALHYACQSLRNQECSLALTGGVSALLSPAPSINFSKAGMLAPDGRCKTFDARADGYVRGEGCGILVLKRLSDAMADGDRILALIRGSAVNQDGPSGGLTVPNGPSQEAVIRQALAAADVAPEEVGLIEAHGTGTSLGDPIEINALAAALGQGRDRDSRLLVGSVKTNIGHTEAAAGVAGVIKVVLSMINRQIPPHLHFHEPNPHIDWQSVPIEVVSQLRDWPADGRRVAGVSSFGFSGTNAHVVIAEGPEVAPPSSEVAHQRPYHLLALTACTEAALKDLSQRYHLHLESHPEQAIGDICHTATSRRSQLAHRLAVVTDSHSRLAGRLSAYATTGPDSSLVVGHATRPPGVAFLFTGQGSQYPGMGHQLYLREPVFRETIERCNEILAGKLETQLVQVLYGDGDECELVHQTRYTQPALFALEYALAQLWASWGIQPAVVIGHSVGEYLAACVAGVLSLEDGLGLISERARLMQELPPGTMAAIFCSETVATEAIEPYRDAVAIAAINAPELVVISGESEPLQEALAALTRQDVDHQLLKVNRAFHSPMVKAVSDELLQAVAAVELGPARLPLISNLTGTRVATGDTLDTDYWCRQTLAPVRFMDSVQAVSAETAQVFLEIGPKPVLTGLARQCLMTDSSQPRWAFSLCRGEDDSRQMLAAVAELFAAGCDIDWDRLDHPFQLRSVSLPTYPFQHKHFRIGAAADKKVDRPAQPPVAAVASVEDPPAAATGGDRYSTLLLRLRTIIHEITGIDLDDIEPDLNLFSMGLDSIMLVRLRQAVERDYGVRISMSELNQSLSTTAAIAARLDHSLPEEQAPAREKIAATETHRSPLADSARLGLGTDGAAELISMQLNIMAQQLELLAGATGTVADSRPRPTSSLVAARPKQGDEREPSGHGRKQSSLPYKRLGSAQELELRDQQQQHVRSLIASYTGKTRGSKRLTQTYRPVFANIRNIAGYRQEWKELIYQIVVDRATGARFWDVDGREYLDMTMGFGVYLFGHSPDFIQERLREVVARGVPIGPMCAQAGQVAQQIHELTGGDRIAFFNTGTEAVMAAVRIARTVTGRSKIVMFSGSYHGHTDNLLVIGHGRETIPMVPGTPFNMVQDTYVVGYDEEASLEFIETHGDELAAVLVEPVQSRKPELQPTEFLRRLRELTHRTGTALIFDEVILGFRIAPGGAQAWFDVKADLVTYGKLIGGGMPIGVVAGSAEYMDAIDGGMWQYGDDSAPPKENTIVAGTFNHHPLAMTAADAVLTRLAAAGPELQAGLNHTTEQLAGRLNLVFESAGVPIRMVHFGSLFRFELSGEHELLNYHLIDKGVYIWEGRNCFISSAHTEQDLDHLVGAVEGSLDEMIAGGLFRDLSPLATGVASAADPVRLPLSSAQHRMFILSQLDGGELGYHVPVALTVEGDLDLEHLHDHLQILIRRHEVLRASFSLEEGELVQTVHPRVELPIERLAATYETIDQVIESFIRPFDLSRAPLIRVGVARLAEHSHLLIVDAHHIIFDGVSAGILFDELARLYNGAPLPDLTSRYRDYVQQEQAYQQSRDHQADQAYWLDTLANVEPATELPLDLPRPPERHFSGKIVFRRLDAERSQALKSLARRLGTTLHMVLLGAHYVLLHKLTSNDDIIVGTTFDGRGGDDSLHGVIGMFVNTLAIRGRLHRKIRFRELVEAIRHSVMEAHDHQRYPFELLVERLGVTRNRNRNPLFDTMFVFESMPASSFRAGPLTLSERDVSVRTAIFDLTHEVVDVDGMLTMSMELSTEIFEPATIDRLLDRYTSVLDAVIRDPDVEVAEINIVPEHELAMLLRDLNDTTVELEDRCLPELLRDQVERTPEAVALLTEAGQLSYSELDARSNQLARSLRSRGVEPEVLVGVYARRSPEMVVALLGVLKAGGVYVPLDPAYPEERLRFMIEDSRIAVLVTQTGIELHLGAAAERLPQVALDHRWSALEEQSSDAPATLTLPLNLAYVIYTSGSTGQPKGVGVSHRSLVNLLRWRQAKMPLSSSDRVMQMTSISFDTSLAETLEPLISGAQLYIPDPEDQVDLNRLLELIDQHQITAIDQDPSFLMQLIASDHDRACRHLRRVNTGGDLVPTALAETVANHLQAALNNCYGPTETTVEVARHLCTGQEPQLTAPIGRPINSCQLYALDDCLQAVARGVAGELFVSGEVLARGYLGRPRLTAERFLPNPYSEQPGARMYRTGDLVRHLTDGNLEFLGRIDNQVKIRGFRVELGEIEATLAHLPSVQACAVTVIQTGSQEKGLAAYIVSDEPLSITDLRAALRQTLPDYMVPASFTRLTELPTTPSGKVDRQALPAPELDRSALAHSFQPPRTAAEQVLAEIWSALLGVDKAGVQDDFFELGGDSIKAIQVVARAQQRGYRLAVRDLFEAPQLAALAARAGTEAKRVSQVPVSGPVPLTPIQAWLLNAGQPQPHHYNQSVMICSEQRLNGEALQAVLEQLQIHHDALRTRFHTNNGKLTQEIGSDCPLSFEVFDLRQSESAAADARDPQARLSEIAQQVHAGIDLEQGPLMHAALLRLEDEDRLLLVVHHLVVDGVSWRILLDDLALGYQLHQSGEAICLPEKTDSYQAWAQAMHQAWQSDAFAQEEAYWRRVEEAASDPIPHDLEGDNLYGSIERVSAQLDAETTSALVSRANRAYTTSVEDLLLVALARALRRHWSLDRTLISLEGHGRHSLLEDLDLSRTVGWFTSLYPFHLELGDEDGIGEQIRFLKERLRQVPSRGIGYGVLRFLGRDAGSYPRPQLCFNYLGQFDDTAGDSGWRPTEDTLGEPVGAPNNRELELEVEAVVLGGRLRLTTAFSNRLHRRETIEILMSTLQEELATLLDHCLDRDQPELTPSDLTYRGLDLDELDRILTDIGVERSNLQDVYPLSPLQLGMLYHNLLDQESSAYFMQIAFQVTGVLDVARFEQAWNALVSRHDALRTAFVHRGAERPLQLVLRERRIPFLSENLSNLAAEQQRARIDSLRDADINQGFDLSKDQLMRVAVFQLGPEAFEVVWSSHHILFDGWCLADLTAELVTRYQALATQTKSEWPTPAPYSSYIKWLEGIDQEQSKQFWSGYLHGFERPSVLAKQRRTGNGRESRVDKVVLELSKADTDRLNQLAAARHVTISTVVRAIWAILLAKRCASDDVVFGVTVSGRPAELPDVEQIIGLFINTVPVRIRTRRGVSFSDLIQQMQQEWLQSEPHHYLSLADIQSVTSLGQELLDHVLVFENYPHAEELRQGRMGLGAQFAIDAVEVIEPTNYDLIIAAYPGRRLRIELQYAHRAYDQSEMEAISSQLAQLFEAALESPQSEIGVISQCLLSAEERQSRDDFMMSVMAVDEDF